MKNVLKKLASLFTPEGARNAYAYWLHVQCDHCGEKIRTRVDLRNDLSACYGETDRDTTYLFHKTIIGSQRCFRPIEVDLTFDVNHQLIERQIQNGKFIGEEEYFDQATE